MLRRCVDIAIKLIDIMHLQLSLNFTCGDNESLRKTSYMEQHKFNV